MDYSQIFPFWQNLSESEKEAIEETCYKEKFSKGLLMHRSTDNCKGLMTVLSGSLRIYIVSDEGREVTLFRVFAGEMCVLSASCLMDTIAFDVLIEATEDTEVLVLPSVSLKRIMQNNPYVELFLYKTATEKFSDVMWTMQQILFKKIDQRVAEFLLAEYNNSNSNTLAITHDEIARYIGSAREVVTKVLKYMAQCEAIELKRGKIIVRDIEKLKYLL